MVRQERPTIRDVADRAGVSYQTVSRVINERGYVAPSTLARVEAAIRDLDYVPNGVARSLSSDRTHTLGVVARDISDHFFGEFVAGAEAEARRQGYYLIIGSVEGVEDEDAYLRLMQQRRVEALIVAHPHLRAASDGRLKEVAQRTPVVLATSAPEDPAVSSVDVDNRAGGRLATEYLLDQGHRAIATITGPRGWSSSHLRLDGYQAALTAAGLEPADELVETGPDWGPESGARAVARLLESGRHFTGLFAHSDLLALGAMRTLRERDLRVPADISVVGFDDIPISRYVDPALTTVRQPMREVGSAAVTLALERILAPAGPPDRPAKHVLLEAQLIIRDSVARPRN